MKNKKSVQFLMSITVYVCMFLLLVSCGGGGDSDSGGAAGQSGAINLTTSTNSLPADGSSSATITAYITDSAGNPVRHYTEVVFTTNLGLFRNGGTSYTMTTQPPLGTDGFPDPNADPTGIAQVQFIAGTTAGAAKITVNSNGVTNSIYVSLTGVSGAIVLTASPTSIPADGSSSSIITATLTDSGGNPVKPGTAVSFMTGLGHFQNGEKTYSLTTPDATGQVQVSLRAGFVPGTSYLVATSNGIAQSLEMTLTNVYASQLSLTANPQYIEADGKSTSLLTANIKTAKGAPVAGAVVTFYYEDPDNLGDPLPSDNTWKGDGPDSFVTPAFYSSGSATFTMSYAGGSTTTFSVQLWNMDTGKVAADLINEPGPVSNQSKTITLGAGNYYFNVISAEAQWSILVQGSIGPAQSGNPEILDVVRTDSSGNAEYTYTSTTAPGPVEITAISGQFTADTVVNEDKNALRDTVIIYQTDGPPPPVTLTAQNTSIYANGENSTSIEATVRDSSGAPVPDGTEVLFSVTAGTLSGASAQNTAQNTVSTTTVNGVASVILTSIASATDVTSEVTATVGTESGSVEVTFKGVSLTNMQATPAAIFGNGADTSSITVRLQDSGGVAISNETVGFATTGGTLATATANTSAEGVATVQLTAPNETGTATVTATYGTLTATATVSFEAVQDGSIVLTANPASIPADGTSTTVITATIKYSSGNPVPKGTSVNFTTSRGTFADGSQNYTTVTPDDTGVVNVSLQAASTAGSAKVTASAISISQTIYVGMGGNAITITLAANPTAIPADGSSSSTITATVKDSSGSPVVQGTSVTFTTNLGIFSGGGTSITLSTPDATGTVSVSLISSITAGTATVTSSSSGVTQSVPVTFTGGGGVVSSIVLTANPVSIPADGSSSSTVTATLTDSSGAAVPAGTSVTFTTDLGAFTGGVTSITVTTPDATGAVSVSLISSTTAGSATVSATSGGVSQSANVTFSGSGVVGSITLTANPSTLSADGTSTSVIRADVRDASNNPVPDGTSISFVILTGTGTLSANTGTTVGGFVEVTYKASTTAGTETIRAMSENYVSATVNITLTSTGVGIITLTAIPESIPADGVSSSAISAVIMDNAGNPVPQGTSVTFTTNLGKFSNGLTTQTVNTLNKTGAVTVSLIAGTTAGTATVTCASNGVSQKITVEFIGGSGTPASLSLAISQTSVKSDNSDSATVTATVLDAANAALAGIVVSFTADGGQISASSAETDANGQARITFSSGTTDRSNQTVTITATVSGLDSKEIPIQITGSTLEITAVDTNLTVGNTTKLTVTAKDAGGNLVNAAPITFSSSDSGVISVPAPPADGYKTGVDGQLSITVSAAGNGSATVTAKWSLSPQASQAFTVGTTGNVFEILLPATDPFSSKTRATANTVWGVSVTFKDNGSGTPDTIEAAGAFAGFAAGEVIMVGGSADNNGVYTISSTVPPTANVLTLVDSDSLTDETTTAAIVTNGVLVWVRAPDPIQSVKFATSIGGWDNGGSQIVTKTVNPENYAWAVLTASVAGSATVQVSDAADSSTVEYTTVAFAVPSGDAAQLAMVSNVYTVAPSVGGIENTATLTATVRTSQAAGAQAVSGATVAFSIENPTGGGEFIKPVVKITDSAGQATTTFTSGSLSSGAEGVKVRAAVNLGELISSDNTIVFNDNSPNADTITRAAGDFAADGFEANQQIWVQGSAQNDGYYTIKQVDALVLTLVSTDSLSDEGPGVSVTISHVITDTVAIIIGGTAGSVVIGRGTVIYDENEATYRLPMSALVTDSNGNAVSGAVVTLSAWPLQYAPGVWYDTDINPQAEKYAVYYTGSFIDNEDVNENLILDPGEDKDGDGKLTPANSSAGGVPVPSQVTTDANGVAAFNLIYLKAQAKWINSRIRASTFVVGTETTSSLSMVLPAEKAQAEEGLLPDSPYPIGLVTGVSSNEPYTFPPFEGDMDAFYPSGNLSAGSSYMSVTPPAPPPADYDYTYNPTGGSKQAVVGDWIWDYITVINSTAGLGAYFPVRIIIE